MRTSLLLIVSLICISCGAQNVNIIPQPVSMQMGKGFFVLNKKTTLVVHNDEDRKNASFFNEYLQQFYGFTLPYSTTANSNFIQLTTRQFVKAPDKDAYQLSVSGDGVRIEGDTYAGSFYGLQSLIQLLPIPGKSTQKEQLNIPQVSIQDYPRFAYRGLHLDMCRHFFPLSFIKKYIDYIALHKMNYFHWHLTDDQGWRIEIKKYPKLTSVGGYRNGTIIGRYPGTGNDNKAYGGFYTQDEIKEIVQYAANRHITVVPEIEMPGHASAAIAAYPWLSCFPDQKTKIPGAASEASQKATGKLVQETWGVFDDVFCAGNDSTFMFLQDVLDEVIPLFPAAYVHVGGDECPKTNWKKCPRCQARMKALGLKDEHELQSYFVQRIEKHVNAKSKILIGWDEILEGGLAPNAWVMSWRGEKGGIEAAKQHHNVIMTPQNPVYFDHTQSQSEDSVTIGGYNPIEKVYAYDPLPDALSSDEAKLIVGAQANLWTEYIAYPSKVEYMIFPRLAALSEVLWTPKEKRSWTDFEKRLPAQFDRYALWGAHVSNAYNDIKTTIGPAPGNAGIQVTMTTKDKGGKLTYGLSGSHFQKDYTKPVIIKQPTLFTGMHLKNGNVMDTVGFYFYFNKATGKKVTLKEMPSNNYPGDGAFTLVNGIQNSGGLTRGREFVGYNGNDMEAVVDLGSSQKITSVVLHTLTQPGSWIYPPSSLSVLSSMDGKQYQTLGSTTDFVTTSGPNGVMKLSFAETTVRYIKLTVKNYGVIPDGQAGAGNRAWLFADEIEVN